MKCEDGIRKEKILEEEILYYDFLTPYTLCFVWQSENAEQVEIVDYQ
jgi:hypothetical protein